MICAIDIARFRVPFKTAFRHAAATRYRADSVIVTAISAAGRFGYGEGCPRSYVTGETAEGAVANLREWAPMFLRSISGCADLRKWIHDNRSDIDRHPAAFCALELALLDLLAREAGQPLEAFLGLPPLAGKFRYSAVLGNSHPIVFRWQLWRYLRAGIRDFKLKLSGDINRDRSRLRALGRQAKNDFRVRLDANNLWRSPEACIRHIEALECPALFALEEPLAAGRFDALLVVSQALDLPIILDESFTHAAQLADLPGEPKHWILNCRVSKLGGLIRSLEAVRMAQDRGHRIVVGAHVGETSLLTRAALTVAQCAGDALVGMEGAFGTRLLSRDLCTPSLMFAGGGLLHAETIAWANTAGNGLRVHDGMLADDNRRPRHQPGAAALSADLPS